MGWSTPKYESCKMQGSFYFKGGHLWCRLQEELVLRFTAGEQEMAMVFQGLKGFVLAAGVI